MTVNERIKAALNPMGFPVKPDRYKGDAESYFVFNYDLIPFQFADNRPTWYKALVQVHLFLPLGENSVARRMETAQALAAAGFTWPEIIDASDRETQHLVFECEAITERTES